MPLPPPVRSLMSSLVIDGGRTSGGKVTLSFPDFQALLKLALAEVQVDETWYLRQYPDVREGIANGEIVSAAEHFRSWGYLESRLPADPIVDEIWYRAQNPDVLASIRDGTFKDAKEHYIQCGYREGRPSGPSGPGAAAPRPLPAAPLPGRFAPR